MNLKKILTVAAVSVAAAAFALLIVIFAMPKPEDRPRPDAKSFDTFAGFTFGDVLSEDAKKEGRTYVDLPCEIKTPWATFTRKGALYGRYTQKLYNVTIFEDDIPGLINGAKERNRVEKLWEMFRDAYDLKLKMEPFGIRRQTPIHLRWNQGREIQRRLFAAAFHRWKKRDPHIR